MRQSKTVLLRLLHTILALSNAGSLTLSAASSGTVVAWGDNSSGKTNIPAGLSGVTAITAGAFHSLALKNDGTVVAWGGGLHGQTNVPVGLSGVVAIAASEHSVALKADGTVVAWGYNFSGQTTGTPTTTPPYSAIANPVMLNGQLLSGVTAIAAGGSHTVALKSDGTVVVWGGDSFNQQTNVPAGLSGVTAIAAGLFHSMALKSDGTVVAWSYNGSGQTSVPVGLNGVTAIAAGGSHSVALKSDGTVVAWGNNANGETSIPGGLNGVKAIAAGGAHTLALKTNGTVAAWGDNEYGQRNIPAGLIRVVAVASGCSARHTLALISPSITSQPVGQNFTLGGVATFSVSADGTGLSYQWQVNGTNILGATNSTLSLRNVSVADAGAYRVVVSSLSDGAVSSQDANLVFFGDLKFLASTILAGPIGSTFRVDYADVLGGATNWLTLTNVTLPYSPFMVIDQASPGKTNRFYRAVPLP